MRHFALCWCGRTIALHPGNVPYPESVECVLVDVARKSALAVGNLWAKTGLGGLGWHFYMRELDRAFDQFEVHA